jgi:hypothetical protein
MEELPSDHQTGNTDKSKGITPWAFRKWDAPIFSLRKDTFVFVSNLYFLSSWSYNY